MTKKEALHELARIEYEKELLLQRQIVAEHIVRAKTKKRKKRK